MHITPSLEASLETPAIRHERFYLSGKTQLLECIRTGDQVMLPRGPSRKS